MLHMLVITIAVLSAEPAPATDLAKLYPATLDYFEGQPTREWTCTKDDVWELESFHFEKRGELEIMLGKTVVVFGVHEKNVVWAAVLPAEAGTIHRRERPGARRSVRVSAQAAKKERKAGKR